MANLPFFFEIVTQRLGAKPNLFLLFFNREIVVFNREIVVLNREIVFLNREIVGIVVLNREIVVFLNR